MNPYLEQPAVWKDFHHRFLPLAAEALGAQLLPRYYVKIGENPYIREPGEESRHLVGYGDLAVTSAAPGNGAQAATAVLEAPAEGLLPEVEVESQAYLEVRDRDTHEVITVVELLSPSNKQTGADREQYLAKRNDLLRSAVHFVEIDLLRGGPRMPLRNLAPCAYCVVVSRAPRRPRAGVWPIQLRDPLPTIPVPVRLGEADATLDLQQLLHRLYDAAGYHLYIYAHEPTPRLGPEDAAWARQFVPAT
jgi:hypothetical protein